MANEQQDPYPLEAQNGIFHFLFILIDTYSQTMPKQAAVQKACDWIISLGTSVKEMADQFKSEEENKIQNFKETTN